jgi:hypothetical protein
MAKTSQRIYTGRAVPLPKLAILAAFLATFCIGSFSPRAVLAEDSSETPDSTLTPATPEEFVKRYRDASVDMSEEGVAALYSEILIGIPHTGPVNFIEGNESQRESLAGLFQRLKSSHVKSMRMGDYTITSLSDDFAIARVTWEIALQDEQVPTRQLSTYVLRLEEDGWRAVAILEMGAPDTR